MAASKLGIKVATPILNGIPLEKINELMDTSGMGKDGKVQLFDGHTGEAFKEKTMV
jgi:DNA-directed RNA polymerase subunit beta